MNEIMPREPMFARRERDARPKAKPAPRPLATPHSQLEKLVYRPS